MVGKSSIITRYLKGHFDKKKERTIEAKPVKKVIFQNGNTFILNIWDTAGEEKYHALAPIFYLNSDGAIIVYDCTDKETFERAQKWFIELKESSEANPKLILVGNKVDLPGKAISSDDGNKLAQKYNAKFLEVSALTGLGVDNIFEILTNDIYQYKSEIKKSFEIGENYINKTKSKKKLVISGSNGRFEKRNNDDSSCGC